MLNEKKHRPNLSEIAYEEIKAMILTGEMTQGQRILLDEISEILNLSITPIREALNKLAQEDLIQIKPRTSHEVISLNEQDSTDIHELRLLLETFALRTAGDNLTRFPVKRFQEIFGRSDLIHNFREFVKHDADFHRAIIATSLNKRLHKLYSYIQNLVQVELVTTARIKGRIEVALKEHLAVLDAIDKGDPDLAIGRLKAHLESVKDLRVKSQV